MAPPVGLASWVLIAQEVLSSASRRNDSKPRDGWTVHTRGRDKWGKAKRVKRVDCPAKCRDQVKVLLEQWRHTGETNETNPTKVNATAKSANLVALQRLAVASVKMRQRSCTVRLHDSSRLAAKVGTATLADQGRSGKRRHEVHEKASRKAPSNQSNWYAL